MIFIDSDVFIGLEVKSDSHHKKASIIANSLSEKEELVTSWQVIDEVTAKLSYFTTKKIAEHFLQKILESNIRIKYVDRHMLSKIQKIFKKQKSKKVSLTDCANMAIAAGLQIDTFFSFDKHYGKNGFKLLKDVT